MQQVNVELLRELLQDHQSPCISIYQPTTRKFAGVNDSAVRFKNMLKEAEELLRQRYPRREFAPLLEKMRPLVDEPEFWRHQLDGLAVFCSPDLLRTVRLQEPVQPVLIVADSFHIKPLIRIVQASDRYEVLCISQRRVALYQGNRDALDEAPLPNVPKNITDALGEELTAPHQTVASYGTGTQGPAMRHGHHSRKDEQDIDVERYLRTIDRALWEHHSRFSDLPVILAAVEEYHPVFHKVSHNPHLVKEGIRLNPDFLEPGRLREEAWKVYEPHYQQRIRKAVESFQVARARGLGTDDVVQVIEAARVGRVGTVLVEERQKIGGHVDWESGRVEFGQFGQPGVEDLLDDVAEKTLKTNGQVFVVPPEQLPTESGVAAIYRY